MTKRNFTIQGNVVDIEQRSIYAAEVSVVDGKISAINKLPNTSLHNFILPGFIDSHVHVESSMLVPSEFARLAVVHGTVGTISDPHEIANVCGMQGIEFMIKNGKQVNFKFNFGAPSCVPATIFETAGAAITSSHVKELLAKPEIKYLSEMMNFPGVLFKDEEVMQKIQYAIDAGKPIDGHAPGLRGEKAKQYIEASLNPSKGGTLDADDIINDYKYQTADPTMYGLLKEFVKEQKRNPTNAEIALWEMLRGKKLEGYKFRRQHIIGSFIADFLSLSRKLIIEVDGAIHNLPENKISDEERTKTLNELGFQVIRFTNNEVLFETEKTLEVIVNKLKQIDINYAASIPPLGGGGAVISTDHECFTADEALDKLGYGMKILIREGSAAKNFEALIPLMNEHYAMMMFCSDDKHPDSLAVGHINQLCARAVAKGIDVFKVLQAACVNPVKHYKLDVGLLNIGDAADFIVAEDLVNFNIVQTYINGELVAENGKSFIESVSVTPINQFECDEITVAQLKIEPQLLPTQQDKTTVTVPVIEALDGQLITNKIWAELPITNGELNSDTTQDILKMVVVNRYYNAPIAKCFIKNFGLKHGALASSVAHDSHNIVAVGVDDESLTRAINLVIKEKGGVSCVSGKVPSFVGEDLSEAVLGLPIAGLMSADDGYKVAAAYTAIDNMTKDVLGSTLLSPFMTLSFMALLVIPSLKLSDQGLFDGEKFEFIHSI
jgi:adenine deaminase